MSFKLALVGNPNVGKTSLYNRITKSFEHVGNWHGVTVEQKEKTVSSKGGEITVTDLPGLYSLSVYSPEEGITRDCLLSGENNVLVSVCDVNNLARNIYLTLQLIELGAPTVLVTNMTDELKRQGRAFDPSRIEKELGIRVVQASAKYKTDAEQLFEAARATYAAPKQKKELPYFEKLPLGKVRRIVSDNLKKSGLPENYALIKLLEKDSFVENKLSLSERQKSEIAALGDHREKIAACRFEYIDRLLAGAFTEKGGKKRRAALGVFDRIALNKWLALPLFFLLMGGVFFVTFGFVGGTLSALFEWLIDLALTRPIGGALTGSGAPDWLCALVIDGIIGGVGGVIVFLPQIVLLFFFLALFEDSGYISRVAFMTDGLFAKIGLSGRSVFTLLMGFGCSATAVLTARSLEDENTRRKTVLFTPFMSCSARLPVYAALCGAFFAGSKPLVIFALYLLGALVAVTLAALAQKIKKFKSGKLSFIMEMPPYRFPTAERVFQIIASNTKTFLVRVGTTVFAVGVMIWVLSNFSLTAGFTGGGEGSILQTAAGLVAPLLSPLGFGNWQAATALLGGLVAKETVISVIESFGGVSAVFCGAHAEAAAMAFMTFTLLYTPCIATLSAVKKEIGTRFMLLGLFMQTAVAYIVSLIVYNTGVLIATLPAAKWIALALIIAVMTVLALVAAVKRRNKGCAGGCGNCKGCRVKEKP